MKAAPDFAALGDALGLFGTGLSQHARLIPLESSQDSALRHGDKTACGATLIAGQQASIDNL